ncbi:MAG: RluA family pseudouridine synthase, partial [Chloroflexota bacterium]|nr:RluA family pseudouridine synthase [Chloroflexota bacterium]
MEVSEEEKLTLRAVLREFGLSNTQLKRAVSCGKVLIRGVPTADTGRMVRRPEVSYVPDARRLTPGRDLCILYKDPDLVVVWKPSGWLSVRAPGRSRDSDVVSYVGKLYGGSFVVHRLDEGTSGAMMVALNEATQFKIKALLEKHDIERRYLALVRGRPEKDRWTMETHFVRNRGDGLRGSGEAGPEAKHAVTHFEVVQRLETGVALVRATLESGRTHQVRIHLAESGHPVLGDKLYADSGSARRFPRVALHAAVLGFKHPSTGESKYFDIPLADDLEQFRRGAATKKPLEPGSRREEKRKSKRLSPVAKRRAKVKAKKVK